MKRTSHPLPSAASTTFRYTVAPSEIPDTRYPFPNLYPSQYLCKCECSSQFGIEDAPLAAREVVAAKLPATHPRYPAIPQAPLEFAVFASMS
jgi:hypothetical protein